MIRPILLIDNWNENFDYVTINFSDWPKGLAQRTTIIRKYMIFQQFANGSEGCMIGILLIS